MSTETNESIVENLSEYVTLPHAAKVAGVGGSTMYRWVSQRRIPAIQVGPRALFVRLADVLEAKKPKRGRPMLAVPDASALGCAPTP